MSRFSSVVLDTDSTLSGIEGIDWLASLRGPVIERRIARLTEDAMQGVTTLELVYGERLKVVKPTFLEVTQLGQAYLQEMAPLARESLASLREAGIQLVIVSGGLRQALLPLARELGLEDETVHAVRVFFDERGNYAGFDERSVLTQQAGKRETVAQMTLKRPILAVGDGMTDMEIEPVADAFAVFTGFVRRESVVRRARYELQSFDQLKEFVLG
ncbi:MAG: HAD-IB family phosphatase [Chloroflexi bacterium]|nr:HAD-IB family phosphatase [Chloroflexota bacterium]